MLLDILRIKLKKPQHDTRYRTFWQYIHIDITLLTFLLLLAAAGLFILFSASSQNPRAIELQIARLMLAFFIMFVVAQISPATLQRLAPWLYLLGLTLLITVLVIGRIGKGAQRWLDLGIVHFQPAELMKLAIPLLLAWYYHRIHLPLTTRSVLVAIPIIFIPAFLTAKQPDLGTAILLAIAGSSVLFLAGLSWRIITSALTLLIVCVPFAWYVLHDYQRQRVLTFLNPERDPLGAGYHIIQSKIAIGSGGWFGKGWLNGTQSNLHFLPEHSTDFIFAVCGEEFGFVGNMILIVLYMLVVLRGLYITINAQDTFTRLLAGSITFTFFVSFFINMGMVTGILPVVGIPLPLVSYGGSSMVTMMISFGMLMSIQTHRKLVTT
ncbi:rod shape-determining protein RodA [Aquicella lusitana]|uniref:Peptidoglycan glycosyltransferase MrdB n=1 Tax=Aquicella lusitana TaxID=254246 RepID=A0A370GHL7_9COXI|nr:rod shape-determining protein RodA [Aquicella lusitana]RDI42850.1 cell elongation-specific peptidoglycan biosynthesis regulator RodA [Aquicella lusitana]VVC73093.1 Rod shape-determining protein RodA [Aquicella lusitana]